MFLKVNVDNENLSEKSEQEVCQYPTDLRLDDEVRLDKIKFADNSSNKYPYLTGLQQAVIQGTL